jgi:hypothetical protein
MSRNIKDYDGILTKFVFLNSMLILIMLSIVNIKNSDSILDLVEKVQTSGIGLIFASILTLLINGILKTDYKNIMVFWKVKQPLPSYRVFSHLVKNDHRIDYDELNTKYNPLPLDPESQSKLWYKMLKKYPDDEMILQSHRDYLLYRDLTAISFLLSVIYLITFLLLKIFGINISILLILVFLGEYLILLIAARAKAERFVLNVVSCDLTSSVTN